MNLAFSWHLPLSPILAFFVTVFQLLSSVQLFVTPWTAACQASLSFTISLILLKLIPLSPWCHPTISSSVVPFSSCLQSFPASGSFLMSQFFTSDGQSVGASASVLPNKYSGLISFRIDWLDLLAVQSVQGTLKSLTPQYKSINSLVLSFLYSPTLTSIHDYWKNHSLD